MLVEAVPAQRTGYPCDALRASASRIHHPDNTELLGAIGTRGNKLIGHGAPPSKLQLALEVERQPHKWSLV
jgi:hypothetical protein